MKTKIFNLILAFVSASAFSQVGINTTTPSATLDINGTAKIRSTPAAPSITGHQILALDQGTFQVKQIDPQTLFDSSTDASVYAAKKTSTINLLSLGLFPAGFRAVDFLQAERNVGNAALFSDVDNTYTIPTSGVYAVGFYFRLGTGIQASLLPNSPGIGIVRTRAGVSTLIDSRPFNGANLILLSLTLSEAHVNSLYTFQAGDKLSFGLTGSSLINAGLLSSSIGSFYVHKVSN